MGIPAADSTTPKRGDRHAMTAVRAGAEHPPWHRNSTMGVRDLFQHSRYRFSFARRRALIGTWEPWVESQRRRPVVLQALPLTFSLYSLLIAQPKHGEPL